MAQYTLADFRPSEKPTGNKVFKDRIFDEHKMYEYLEQYASEHGLEQFERALPFARASHTGQMRKGNGKVPYLNHPLSMTCHLISMGIDEDEILAASMLHDVCEDCGVSAQDLPVSEPVREAVMLLTKPDPLPEDPSWQEDYYGNIMQSRIASVIKLADRCNNVSEMSASFTLSALRRYGKNTFDYIMPVLEHLEETWPEYADAAFLLRYQLSAVLGSVQRCCEEADRAALGKTPDESGS